MNILWIANDNCANNPNTIVSSINELTEHTAELIMSKKNYLHYPNGTMINDVTVHEFVAKISRATVIHLNEPVCSGQYPPEAGQRFKDSEKRVLLWDLIRKKRVIFRHSNGTYGRNNYPEINSQCIKMNIHQTVSTPDLLKLLTGARWLPQPTDLDNAGHAFGPAPYDEKRIIISHSPTDRYFKTTDYFLSVIRDLQSEGHPIEVRLVEGKTHAQCMAIRRGAHIHFDQFMLGAYGRAAVEGLAMGQIVVVGLANIIEYVPDHPFVPANYFSLKTSILRAISILKKKRGPWLANGRAWVEHHHDRKRVVKNLLLMYEQARKKRCKK